MRSIKSVVRTGLMGLACGLFLGCGGGEDDRVSVVPAGGTVYLDDQPHGPVTLSLTPVAAEEGDKRPTIGAEVKDDGSFTLTTYDTGDGAPPGEYTATLSAAVKADSTDPADMAAMMGGGGPATSSLTVTIPAEGSTSLELKFTSTGEKTKPQTGPPAPIGTDGTN